MRNKKILITVFSLFIFFALSMTAHAKQQPYNCKYANVGEDIKITFRIRVAKNGKTTSETAKIEGGGIAFNSNYESVKNWSNDFFENVSFNGADYYESNTDCPPYALLSKSRTGYNLFVADDSSQSAIENAIKNKYSTLEPNYPIKLNRTRNAEEVVEKPEPSSCMDFDQTPNSMYDGGTCENNKYFACVWVENKDYNGYCNVDKLQYVKCEGAYDIPMAAPAIISFVVNFFKIAAPILLVLVSVITLVKAVASSSEDEIVKARKKLIKKVIYAVMVFFVIQIVQFVILKAADSSEEGNINSCLSCFLNNDCSDSAYYKTNVGGIDICTYLDGEPYPDCK